MLADDRRPAGPQPRLDRLFGALAGDGWFPSPAHVLRRAAILDILARFPAGRMIEMGCGAGRLIVDWDRQGHSGVAVEPDDRARELATKCVRLFGARFNVVAKADDELFDLLVSTEVLEHLDAPHAALRAWLRNLKPGGVAVLTVPAFQRYWGASDEWAGHVRRFEPDDMRRMAEDCGLEVEQMRLYGFPVGNWLRSLGNLASAYRVKSRGQALDRQEATFASGRDRTLESAVAPILRSAPARAMLSVAIVCQRRFNRGHGLIVVARKPAA